MSGAHRIRSRLSVRLKKVVDHARENEVLKQRRVFEKRRGNPKLGIRKEDVGGESISVYIYSNSQLVFARNVTLSEVRGDGSRAYKSGKDGSSITRRRNVDDKDFAKDIIDS